MVQGLKEVSNDVTYYAVLRVWHTNIWAYKDINIIGEWEYLFLSFLFICFSAQQS